MQEQIAGHARDILAAAGRTEVPAELRAVGQDSVAKARKACATWHAAVENGAKVLEDVLLAAQSNAKLVSRKIVDNAVTNANAALEAAEQLACAKTFPEAAQLQAKFVQAQMSVIGEQANALLELSFKVTKQAADTFVAAATNAVGDHNRAAT
jgi:hypothetical protein